MIRIDDQVRYQRVTGFGAAMTDTSRRANRIPSYGVFPSPTTTRTSSPRCGRCWRSTTRSRSSPGIIPYPVSEVAIDATRNWASAVGLWNLALDPAGGPVQLPNTGCGGCTGLVTIDEQTHTAALGLGYYQLGQVSKFVAPGAFRIRSDRLVSDFHSPSGAYGVTAGLDDVAFLNPNGERVLVAYDNSPAPIQFAVQWRGRSFLYTLRPWATVTFTWSRTA